MEVGRPTVMTDAVLQKLEEVFALGGTDTGACMYADISPATLYNYQNDNPDFVERKNALKEKPFLAARRTIVGSLSDPDYAFKFMEKKKKKEFGNAIDVTGNMTISQVLDTLQDGQTPTG